jgi:Putative transmembrane protein (PGPGW)
MPEVPRWVWFPLGATVRFVLRNGRRILVSAAGFGLIAIGLVLLVVPGPGVLLLGAGLAVLASEYVWAQRALNYARRQAARVRERARRGRGPRDAQGR